jgi:hypothetical protein
VKCRECGSDHRVTVLSGGPFCDACICAMMNEDGPTVVVYPSWVSNEDHFGGLTYAEVTA